MYALRFKIGNQQMGVLRSFTGLAGLALILTCIVDAGPFAFAAGGDATAKNPKIKNAVAADKAPQKAQPLALPDTTIALAKQYCAAIQDQAAEARYAWQMAQLEQMAKQVEERIELLDKRSAVLSEWMAKREAFHKQATDNLVGIFSGMKSEAASDQLVRLTTATAAAIVSKLDQRAASAILNDMPADKAAKITAVLAEAARKSDPDSTQ